MPRVAVVVVLAVSLLYLLLGMIKPRAADAPRSFGFHLTLLAIAIINIFTHTLHAIFIPSIAINVFLTLMVLASLRKTSVPFLERFYRLEHTADLPLEVRQQTRLMTWIWGLFFAVMASLSLLLALLAPLEIWSLFANILYFVFLIALVVTMHTYLYLRLRAGGVTLSWGVIRKILQLAPTHPTHPFFGYIRGASK